MLRRIIGEHIYMETNLAPDLWAVRVDPSQIEQVVINLVVNARDAMPDGGRLTIETANVILDKEYVADHLGAQQGEHVRLSVGDTGIGMSAEVKARIFEPFFTTKEMGRGTGLGLATVYGIVQQSQGHIWVSSEEGQGTLFEIYLPKASETAAPMAQIERANDLPRGKETILLAEDDPSVREVVVAILSGQGYTVLAAADGEQALHLAREHGQEIRLLLTDVVMPGMRGKELARQLAQSQPGLKTLFMSGYIDSTSLGDDVLDMDAAFIEKPFSPRALVRKVREVLEG
jgi:CheY-like chemotaxis protein